MGCLPEINVYNVVNKRNNVLYWHSESFLKGDYLQFILKHRTNSKGIFVRLNKKMKFKRNVNNFMFLTMYFKLFNLRHT